jgi:hypothetical protein
VEDIADQMLSVPIQDETFNRHHINDDPNLVKIHEHLEPWLTEYLGKPVKKSYCFLSIYREGGICPKHTDRPQCEYTIDLCVSQKQPWTIYVDDQPFDMQENEAVIYSGTNSPHYRNRLQEGNHCFLVFYHFVDADFVGPLQ